MKGDEVKAVTTPRHSRGLKSATTMSVTKSKPAWPTSVMIRPTAKAAGVWAEATTTKPIV